MELSLPLVCCVTCKGAMNTIERQVLQLESEYVTEGGVPSLTLLVLLLLHCGFYPAGKSTTGPRFGRAQSAKVPAHSEVVPTFPSGGQLPALWCTQLRMSSPALQLKPHMAHNVCDAPCFVTKLAFYLNVWGL